MKINIRSIMAREAEKKAEVKPLPKISVGKGKESVRNDIPPPGEPPPVHSAKSGDEKDELMKGLWAELSAIKTKRGLLSTENARLVRSVYERLQKESPALADAFMAGNLPDEEIKEHYAKIEAYTDQAIVVWDKIQYVDRYGKLPPGDPDIPSLEANTADVSVLKYEIRRLDDRIYKTGKKLEGPPPKNPSRLAQWKQMLAMDKALREDLKQKLKRQQYGTKA